MLEILLRWKSRCWKFYYDGVASERKFYYDGSGNFITNFFIVTLQPWRGPDPYSPTGFTLQPYNNSKEQGRTTIERKIAMVQDTSKLKRNIPLEELFMDKIDDILYGMLIVKATYNQNSDELYLSNEKYLEARKEYTALTRKTDRTARNKVDKMVEYGYIIKKLDSKNREYLVIKDKHTLWQVVKYDMLRYLVTTKSQSSVKIYAYLLNKFIYKQGSGEGWSFTLEELAQVLGYSESSSKSGNVTTSMRMIIEDLARTKVINYKVYSDGKTQRMRLIWVEQDYNKLEKVG